MGWNRRLGLALRIVMLGGAAASLIGCQSIREAAGVEKSPPDEFAVVTKAPLVIPPDYNLRPPSPGAPPTNQMSPTASAQADLSGTDPTVVAQGLPTTYSPAEKNLLANSGAATADHTIRTQIAADAKSMATANDSFTDALLFGLGPKPDTGKPVDADAEHDRLIAEKNDGQTPVTGLPTTQKDAQEGASIDKNGDRGASKVKDDSGWFDGLFDGIF